MADEILSISVMNGINEVKLQLTGAVLIDVVIEGVIVFDGAVNFSHIYQAY